MDSPLTVSRAAAKEASDQRQEPGADDDDRPPLAEIERSPPRSEDRLEVPVAGDEDRRGDRDQSGTCGKQVTLAEDQAVGHHAEARRSRTDQRPGVGPALPVASR